MFDPVVRIHPVMTGWFSWTCAWMFGHRDHSESESLGGGERKETRKKYGSTISCIWGEAVHGMRILWRPYSQSYFWAEPPKIMLGRKPVSTR